MDFQFGRVFCGCLFIVEIDVKDDFLLKNEILPCKNGDFVYTGEQAYML